MNPEYREHKKGSLRPKNMTIKEYAVYLGGISERTIENWEYRGTNQTTFHLLMKIREQDSLISELKEIIKKQQLTFELPKKR